MAGGERARTFLTDFGLAKNVATASKFTRTGEALGTPQYMSPEQARGEVGGLTAATDVWALGCVLYELVAARRAFDGDTAAAIVGKVITGRPVPASVACPGLPRPVAQLIANCLAPRLDSRYPSAGFLRDECETVLEGGRPLALAQRRRNAWIGLVTTGAAILALSLFLAWPRGGTAPAAGRPSPMQAVADTAWAQRTADPAAGARQLQAALAEHPDRHDWRVRLGILQWMARDPEAARATWAAVPPGSPHHGWAQLHTGLADLVRFIEAREFYLRSRAAFEAAAAAPGDAAPLAQAALAIHDEQWRQVVVLLRDRREWQAALIRGFAEAQNPDGEAQKARADLEAVLAAGLDLAWIHIDVAGALSEAGDTAGAVRHTRRALELRPRLRAAWMNLVRYLVALNDLGPALDAADQLVALHPGAPALAQRARVRHLRNDIDGALADLDRSLELDPGHREARSLRSLIRMERRDLRGAMADLEVVLENEPDNIEALYNAATLLGQAGRHDEAIARFDAVLALDPTHPKALLNRAIAKIRAGRPVQAMADFDRVVATQPDNPEAFYNRGLARDRLGQTDGALTDLARALELDPDHARAWGTRGGIYHGLGRYDEALAQFDHAVQLEPREGLWRLNRGILHQTLGRLDAARADYDASIQLRPAVPAAYLALAKLERSRGRWADALAAARTLVAVAAGDPRLDEFRALLAECEAGARGR